MLEKKKKFMSYSLEADMSGICDVDAYIDNGKVVAYNGGDGCVRLPKKCENFFDTQEEAEEYIRTRIAALRKAAEYISKIIWEVYNYEDTYDCEHAVTMKDFNIPEDPIEKHKHETLINRMSRCIRTRLINLACSTILIDSIERIEWNGRAYEPTVLLDNGDRIKVTDRDEIELLRLIYG